MRKEKKEEKNARVEKGDGGTHREDEDEERDDLENEKFEEADEDEPLEATLLPSEPAEEERCEAVEDDARHEAEEPVPVAGGKRHTTKTTTIMQDNRLTSQPCCQIC